MTLPPTLASDLRSDAGAQAIPVVPGRVAPRLCDGLVVARTDTGLVIAGGSRRQQFTGAVARDLMPRLLPLLDGAHSEEIICAVVGCSERELSLTLAALDGCGLLERCAVRCDVSPGVPEDVAAYLSRTARATGHRRSAAELTAALANAAVLIKCAKGLADSVATDLTEVGVGEVRVADRATSEKGWQARLSGRCLRTLIVVQDDPAGMSRLEAVVSDMEGSRTPVLRVAGCGADFEVGPLFCRDLTACVRCFRTARRDSKDLPADGATMAGRSESPEVANPDTGLLSGLVTAEILAILVELTRPASAGAFLRVSVPDCHVELWPVLSGAGCPTCAFPAAGEPTPAAVYEHTLELPALSLSRAVASVPSARFHQPSERSRILELPYSPRAPLAPAALAATSVQKVGEQPQPAAADNGPPAMAPHVVGKLLEDMVAVYEKWTASGCRALDMYVLTKTQVTGWPTIVTKYDHVSHAVVALRADTVPLESCLSETDLDPSSFGLVIILVGALARVPTADNYSALRTLHLEAGCGLVQLAASSAREHLALRLASAWTAQIAELLELDTRREIVIAIAGIRQR
jgi:hypothetical protein